MSKAIVYHAPLHFMQLFWLKPDDRTVQKARDGFPQYHKVLELDLPNFTGEAAAEEVFDLTNNPDRDGDRAKVGAISMRPLASGDVVEVDGERWLCLSIGWTKL